jgi:hypothetical protein
MTLGGTLSLLKNMSEFHLRGQQNIADQGNTL